MCGLHRQYNITKPVYYNGGHIAQSLHTYDIGYGICDPQLYPRVGKIYVTDIREYLIQHFQNMSGFPTINSMVYIVIIL